MCEHLQALSRLFLFFCMRSKFRQVPYTRKFSKFFPQSSFFWGLYLFILSMFLISWHGYLELLLKTSNYLLSSISIDISIYYIPYLIEVFAAVIKVINVERTQ